MELKIDLLTLTPDSILPSHMPDEQPPIASITRKVTIPAPATDSANDPFDLGTVELVPSLQSASIR